MVQGKGKRAKQEKLVSREKALQVEEHNLVDERDEQEIEERRNELITWRARVNAIHEGKIAAG